MKPTRLAFVDGSAAELGADGAWDLTLPNNKHIRGRAADVNAAIEAVNAAHVEYVLECWNKGEPIAKCRFVCPLT